MLPALRLDHGSSGDHWRPHRRHPRQRQADRGPADRRAGVIAARPTAPRTPGRQVGDGVLQSTPVRRVARIGLEAAFGCSGNVGAADRQAGTGRSGAASPTSGQSLEMIYSSAPAAWCPRHRPAGCSWHSGPERFTAAAMADHSSRAGMAVSVPASARSGRWPVLPSTMRRRTGCR